jgi:hypothetical protein
MTMMTMMTMVMMLLMMMMLLVLLLLLMMMMLSIPGEGNFILERSCSLEARAQLNTSYHNCCCCCCRNCHYVHHHHCHQHHLQGNPEMHCSLMQPTQIQQRPPPAQVVMIVNHPPAYHRCGCVHQHQHEYEHGHHGAPEVIIVFNNTVTTTTSARSSNNSRLTCNIYTDVGWGTSTARIPNRRRTCKLVPTSCHIVCT